MPKRTQKSPCSSQSHLIFSQSSQSQQNNSLKLSFMGAENGEDSLEESVNNCIRYIVYRAGSNLPIRKTEIQEHVLHGVGKNFALVMEHVTPILQKIYGYKLEPCEETNNSKPKSYIVSNILPYMNYEDEAEELIVPSNVHNILIMLVLTHVFMSKGVASDASLYAFLNNLSIDVEKKHEVFGNVKDFVNSRMVKQKYLDLQVENNPKRIMYSWGARAEKTVSKHELLKFVAKMYENRRPESWAVQFEEANKQTFQPIRQTQSQEEVMDLD